MAMERQVLRPNGVVIDISLAIAPLRDSSGQIHGYLSIVADIAERKATEEKLRLSQRMEAVGAFTGGVAHDFNNLLGVISGNLELVD
jgi:signal transduction histidine kinase